MSLEASILKKDNAQKAPLVEVLGLTKKFKEADEPSLFDISLKLQKGEMAALVGPDGAGKTTFLRHICGLLIPSSGKILIDGLSPVSNLDNVKEIIGYMPQKFGLYEDLTVIENLNLYVALNSAEKGKKKGRGRALGKSGEDEKERVQTLLEFAGLSAFKERLAGKLSGGMKQKLGLCCTLVSNPKLLLLDEPSVGVDPLSRRELMRIVQKLVKENDITVIWSTSYLDEAEKFERVFLFSEGRKIYDGPPKSSEISQKGGFENFVIKKIEDRREKTGKASARLIEAKSDILVPKDGVTICALGLTKIYGKKSFKARFFKKSGREEFVSGSEFVAANNISFKIKKGEIFGLLGPNGAGKSTTFKMLCGLIRPTSGMCSIMGVKMSENPILARSYLGYMAQKFSLFGNLSVRQNLNFFAGVYGLFGFEKNRRIGTLLDFFDLKKYENIDAESLPLGFKQRLALSCAIVHRPPVLFLDEPTSGVDPISRREFWEQIKSLARGGTTVLVTTHFMDEAQFCNRISLIYKGKSLVCDTPLGLKNMVKTDKNPNPTMEDAFIELILREERGKNASGAGDAGVFGSSGFTDMRTTGMEGAK